MVDGIPEGPQIKPLCPQMLHYFCSPVLAGSFLRGGQFQVQCVPLGAEITFVELPANLILKEMMTGWRFDG